MRLRYERCSGKPPVWDSIPVQEADVFASNITETIKGPADLGKELDLVVSTKNHRCQIATTPFAKGKVRYAYRARLHDGDSWKACIVKKFIDPAERTPANYQAQVQQDTFARFLAARWMQEKMFPHGPRHTGEGVEYVESRIIEVRGADDNTEQFSLEDEVRGADTWAKYTTNNGGSDESTAAELLRFSQWTHDYSGGYLMVTDIQGGKHRDGYSLTDSAVLCKDTGHFFTLTDFDPAQMTQCLAAVKDDLKSAGGLALSPSCSPTGDGSEAPGTVPVVHNTSQTGVAVPISEANPGVDVTDPADTESMQGEKYLSQHKQFCGEKWGQYRRVPVEMRGQNMTDIGCMVNGAPLPPIEKNLSVLLDYVATNLLRLATELGVTNPTMDTVTKAVFKHLLTETTGFINIEVLDGICLTEGVPIPTVPVLSLTDHGGPIPLQRNGPIECDISLMRDVGKRDCPIVAMNNLVGHAQYSREKLAGFNAKFANGDMPVAQLAQIIGQGKSPYVGKVIKSLTGSYEVFRETQGMYLICCELHLKTKDVQHHTIGFDANRGVVNFGLNDTGWQVTLIIENPDRTDVGSAEANLLKHFNDNLKKIKVVHVIQMMVKTRKIHFTPDFTQDTYELVEGIDDMDIVNTDDDGAGVFAKGSTEYEGLRKEESKVEYVAPQKRGCRGGKKRKRKNECEP